jgi:hypothetical protein
VLRLCPVPVVVVSPGAGDRDEGPVAVAAGQAAPIGQASARTEHRHPLPARGEVVSTTAGRSPPAGGSAGYSAAKNTTVTAAMSTYPQPAMPSP